MNYLLSGDIETKDGRRAQIFTGKAQGMYTHFDSTVAVIYT